MAQPNTKRLKRSLKVRKSSLVVEKQDDSVQTRESSSVKTNVVARENSGIVELLRNSPSKCVVGDNNVTDPAVSDSLSSLRHTLCQLLPGFLGVKASDWRNLPPLIIPSKIEITEETPPTKDEEENPPSTWTPLPSVCRPCAMRTHCRYESPSIDAAKREGSDTEQTMGKAPHHEQLPAKAPRHEQLTGKSPHHKQLTGKAPHHKLLTGNVPRHEQLTGNVPHYEQLTGISTPSDFMPSTSGVSSKPAGFKPLFKKVEPQPSSSSKSHRIKGPVPESPNRDGNMDSMSVQQENVDAIDTKQLNPTPISTCPICQTKFDVNLSSVDIDGHIAACFAASDEDLTCLSNTGKSQRTNSPRKSQGVKRPLPESPDVESSFELMNSQQEDVAAAEPDRKQQNPTPITTCPLCETSFDLNLSQVDIDGHIAACLAAADDDGASLFKSTKPQTRTSSSKSRGVKQSRSESPDRNADNRFMSFEQEAMAAVEPNTQQQNSTPLTTCPLCQTRFDMNLSPVDIDGHIAACFAAADDDDLLF